MATVRRAGLAVPILLLLALPACDTGTDPEATPSWEKDVLSHSFNVNGVPVQTYEDSTASGLVRRHVLRTALPSEALTSFLIDVYIARDPDVVLRIWDPSVIASREDGSDSGEIFAGGTMLPDATIDGQKYMGMRFRGSYQGSPTLGRNDFAGIRYAMTIDYEDRDENILGTRHVAIEVAVSDNP